MRRTIDARAADAARWMATGLLLVAGALALPGSVRPVYADEPVVEKREAERPSVDAADVYLGSAGTFHKPAEVDADAVYRQIAEYKRIVDEEIEPGSARYELLLNKASRRFMAALRKAARNGSYDLIARSGSVKNATDVPDITQDVIDQL